MNNLFTITTATTSAAPKWLEKIKNKTKTVNAGLFTILIFYIFIRMEIITQIVVECVFFDTS